MVKHVLGATCFTSKSDVGQTITLQHCADCGEQVDGRCCVREQNAMNGHGESLPSIFTAPVCASSDLCFVDSHLVHVVKSLCSGRVGPPS